eukprot:364621-Chlamydomonas_euryale.AAC.1
MLCKGLLPRDKGRGLGEQLDRLEAAAETLSVVFWSCISATAFGTTNMARLRAPCVRADRVQPRGWLQAVAGGVAACAAAAHQEQHAARGAHCAAAAARAGGPGLGSRTC